jgi:[acyl-carrier-protein] S-malonyltransferase
LEQRGLLKELRYVLGLSLGELTALAAAGVFDFATGLRLVQARAQWMQKACEKTDGGMLCFIGGQQENVERLCQTFDVDLSNRNCPEQIVVSGPKERLEALRKAAQTMGFRQIVPLQVAGAYHSRLMQKARDGFRKDLEKCSLNRPRYTVLSNVSGTPMDSRRIRQTLEEQVVSTVLWEPSLSYLHANGLRHGVECGSKNILAGLAKRTHPDFSITVLSESEDLDKNA